MKYNTFLPIFPGFYNTEFEFNYDGLNDVIQDERKEKRLYSDSTIEPRIDDDAYETDVIEAFIDILKSEMNDFINDIMFQKILHPREYNFANDSVDVEIDIKADAIKNYIYEHKEAFEIFLKNRYTSRSGFIPWYSVDFNEWEADTKNFTDYAVNGHYLGSILEFIAGTEKINRECFFDIFCDFCPENYCKNLDEIINETDNSLYEFFTKAGYSTTYTNGLIEKINCNEQTLAIIKEFEACKAEA